MIFGVVFLHVAALHITGSNNPLGIDPKGPQDTLPFHPYYTVKDSVGIVVYLIVFAVLVFFAPNLLGHPDNYIPANPLVTPPHIVPEWYFLPYYAILRAVPDKLGGVVLMVGLHRHPVRAALARHQPGALHALPALRAHRSCCSGCVSFFVLMYCGAQAAGGALRDDRPRRHALLLRVLPGDPAGARGQGTDLAAAGEHIHAGAARRRPAAGRRHGQADGEGVMARLSLRSRCGARPGGGRAAAPRRRRHHGPALAAGEAVHPPDTKFSFDGLFGTFDRASAQRGFQVYKEVCANCHSMRQHFYRNLRELGLSDLEVRSIAATVQVNDGPNDEGQMFERPGRPSDRFRSPFTNEKAARAANNGALRPTCPSSSRRGRTARTTSTRCSPATRTLPRTSS